MIYRTLGRSGIKVSPISVGCWSFGGGSYWGQQSQSDVNEVVSRALDEGLNFFDTAELYNGGESERSLGQALAGRRNEAVIGSKTGPDNAYYDTLIAHCEASLRRLGTDHLDLFMIHWPINPRSICHFTSDPEKVKNPPTIQEAMEAMMKLRKDGKIRAIGVSNFGVTQMQEALDTGAQIDVNEVTYNIVSRAIEAEIVPFCLKNQISIVGSMALMQGLLTGKYESADQIPMNQAHSRHFANERGQGTSRHGGPGAEKEIFDAIRQLRPIAEQCGATMGQLAIAWTLHKPGIAAALVGSRTIRQLEENLRAANLSLTPDVVAEIDRISQPVLVLQGSSPDYYESIENSRIY